MTHYFFNAITGSFFFDEHFKIIPYSKDAEEIGFDSQNLYPVMEKLKEQGLFADYYQKNIKKTESDIQNSIGFDNMIAQAVNNIDEIDKTINLHVKRLREWYELYFPDASRKVADHEAFVNIIHNKTREQVEKELKAKNEMGAEFGGEDLAEINKLVELILAAISLRESHKKYLEDIMDKSCSNLKGAAGVMIGAKLIALAGSFKRLAMLPASTVQLLGAEKALFRHLSTNANCPKYGILMQHPFVSNAAKKGRAARMLANKISKAVKMDYFKDEKNTA